MTLERDRAADLFGLAGTFPRPGWVVLDAARDHRFTGELAFDVSPEVFVFLDRGRIYLAERVTDPSLGARLVDAGALNAAQLEHGSMRVGDTEHLGRLFERVPSVDRQSTMLITELMSESCVAWLAGQSVRAVTSTPYRHHPAGIHRWDRHPDAIDLSPGDPLPAPTPTQAPIEIAPPESIFTEFSNDIDAVIHWNEPSWLDERTTGERRSALAGEPESATDPASLLATDWIDQLEEEGLPQPGSDPLAPKPSLPSIATRAPDRFEVIWPSGEIGSDEPDPDLPPGDHDRQGPTARVARTVATEPSAPAPAPATLDEPDLWNADSTRPSFAPPESVSPAEPDETAIESTEADEVALSMRRAVASIETGSLAARRRLSDTSVHESSRGTELSVPGRVATRSESSVWSAAGPTEEASRSVFDEPAPAASPVVPPPETAIAISSVDPADHAEPERVSALRRLIGGLRRR